MSSVASLKRRFESALASSDLYTAEQTCRTISHRLRSIKGNSAVDSDASAVVEARLALYNGTLALLTRKDYHSGTALGLDLLKDFKTDKVSYTDAKEQIFGIVNAYGDESLEKEPENEKLRFLKAAIEFSKATGPGGRMYGDEFLNTLAAEGKHFLPCTSPRNQSKISY